MTRTKLDLKILMTCMIDEYLDYLWRKAELEVVYVEVDSTIH